MHNYPLYEVDTVNNLKELLLNCTAKYADRIAFRYKEKSEEVQKTYKTFYNDVKCLGTSFISMQIRNSQIAVIGENSYEWIVTYFAAVSTGNVIVPLDKELGSKEIINLLNEAECRVFVYSAQNREIAKEAKEVLKRDLILVDMEKDHKDAESFGFWNLMSEGKAYLDEGNTDFESIKIDSNQVAAIHYTSGTTGVSKGVMLTHKNVASNTIGALNQAQIYDRSVLILPIHHTFGLTAGVSCSLHLGSSICINNSMKRIASDLIYYRPKHLILVPLYVEVLYKKIWQTAKSTNKEGILKILCRLSDALLAIGIDLRKQLFKNVIDAFGGELKVIICGGAPLDSKYVKGFRTFGVNIINGYGITECSPVVSGNRNEYYKDGSVGTALSCCRIKIHDPYEDGDGEILVSGDCVMKGYFKNESETQKVFVDGWFKTGDIGKIDNDGFLYITGRAKNIIIFSNGKNIYPEELEMLVMDIPYVKDALVYSEKDEDDKEISIIAEVYLDEEYTKDRPLEELQKDLSNKIKEINKVLPAYKNISRFKIRETEFKKTTTKKIIRNVRS